MVRRFLLGLSVLLAACVPPQPPVVVPPVTPERAIAVLVSSATGPVAGAAVAVGPYAVTANQDGYALVERIAVGTHRVTVSAASCEPYAGDYAIALGMPDIPVRLSCEPRRPTRAEVLTYRGHLANLRDSAGRVIWTPALPGAPAEARREWLKAIADAGGTHVPIGPFEGGPAYPGVHWPNPDWTQDAAAVRGLVLEILSTPTPAGHGLVPVVFLDGGGDNPRPRLTAFMPVAVAALDGLWDAVLTAPTGWEPVVGAWKSADVSWALERWHAIAPAALIAYHGSPGRLVGSSNPVEPDDPWQGGESEFYKAHGGQYIDIALYQTPHGRALYEDCSEDDESCWLDRWQDYVQRIGAGMNGWRKLPIVLWEGCAFEFFRGQVTETQCREVTSRAMRICQKWNISCGWGNSAPLLSGPVGSLSQPGAGLAGFVLMASTGRDLDVIRIGQAVTVFTGVSLRKPSSHSAFLDHVGCIVSHCADEEMVRPNARRVITVMTDDRLSRHNEARYLQRYSRSSLYPSLRPDESVTFRVTSSRPSPTAILRLRDPRPKPLVKRVSSARFHSFGAAGS